MDSLECDYVKKKKIYRDIFKKSQESVISQLLSLKKSFLCNNCKEVCEFKAVSDSLFVDYPLSCTYKSWQKAAIYKLKNEISKDIYGKIQELLKFRETFSCSRCALCCKFACSEFSPAELKLKAENGDKFANQFLSVFVPYENLEEAFKIYPDYVELLKNKYGSVDEVYFYYCPKLSEDNLCTDYGNRPDICRDFPNNALAILPNSCGFKPWKDEVEIIALTLHALSEIVGFFIEKLEETVSKK